MATEQHPWRGNKKSALLIGINKYYHPLTTDLRGCIMDVTATEKFLQKTAGINTIIKLISPTSPPESGPMPTLDNVVGAFQALAREAEPGDFIYIHYSGHGTRLPSSFHDLKSSAFDESLILVGKEAGKLDYLRDVEIAYLLKQITDKGATVTFVLDCCHSGGATRDDNGEGVRGLDALPTEAFCERDLIRPGASLAASWKRAPTKNTDRSATVMEHWMTSAKGVNFLAACLPSQKAQEIPHGAAVKQGLLTDCLVSVLTKCSGEQLGHLSFEAFYNLVSNRLKNHQDRDATKIQDVVFGGRRSRPIFGVDQIDPSPVVVTDIDPVKGGLGVTLSAGVAHGILPDDEFAIYPADRPIRDLTDYSSPVATCRVISVSDFTAEALVQTNAADLRQVQKGCVAVSVRQILKSHILKPMAVRVLPSDESSGPLVKRVQEIRESISRGSKLIRLADTNQAFFHVHIQTDGSCAVSFTPNGREARVEIGTAIDNLVSRLAHLAIFYNLFGLAAELKSTKAIAVENIGILAEGVEPPEARPFRLGDPPQIPDLELLRLSQNGIRPIDVYSGQSLGIQVRNTSTAPLYIEMLDLEPSWKASRAYPSEHESPLQLEPNEGVNFFIETSMSDKIAGCVQPDEFDRIVIFATRREGPHFPEMILPALGEREAGGYEDDEVPPPVLGGGEGDNGRAVNVRAPPGWHIRHVDIRVLETEAVDG